MIERGAGGSREVAAGPLVGHRLGIDRVGGEVTSCISAPRSRKNQGGGPKIKAAFVPPKPNEFESA